MSEAYDCLEYLIQKRLDSAKISQCDFAARHIGPDETQQNEMLKYLGQGSLNDLMAAVIPKSLLGERDFHLPSALDEAQVEKLLREIAARNEEYVSLIGMGYHASFLPEVIKRNVMENPAWYSAYTPYQPEISQGRLEALLNYQTMTADLMGFDIANASLLDEATAAAEALAMLSRHNRGSAEGAWFVDENTHPQTINVIRTRARAGNTEVIVGNPAVEIEQLGGKVAALLLSYPGTDGLVSDLGPIVELAHRSQIPVVVAADILACAIYKTPGEFGADAAVGSAMRFGLPFFFGGPHPGFIATKEEFSRDMPGRLVGVSKDRQGNTAYRLSLQTREQHIKREKATSNICTSQSLLAIMASMYAIYHGPTGLKRMAETVHLKAAFLAQALTDKGFCIKNKDFFDTIAIEVSNSDQILQRAYDAKINLRKLSSDTITVALDETTGEEVIEKLIEIFTGMSIEEENKQFTFINAQANFGVPENLLRKSLLLPHRTFHAYHSETEMMRYIRKLSDKDLALDRTMIPLGSCTMKLNAAVELAPIGWSAFANIHPFAPKEQYQGWSMLIEDLERYLAELSGYKAVSLQPNAGSQGEFAGLLAVKSYYEDLGQANRNVCLIPKSAHGTNAASAAMAGYKVVSVACDDRGNVDLDDLHAQFLTHKDSVAVLMLTYPSTHGVFEENILEITAMAHQYGSQVYIDGANMNALAGLIRFSDLGGDVSHFNLHKTFAIPHGGGGPGVGPIGVAEHLVKYLPTTETHLLASDTFRKISISAAPYGSAGILPISWAYIRLMGASGLAKASQVAILNANYVKERLSEYYDILYTGPGNYVAHEVILDLRQITKDTSVSVEDIAKRLMDFGIHAPTVAFPVANTLMIEPTESESKAELDKFCDAMAVIKNEIDDIASGLVALEQSPLTNAPHTAEMLLEEAWDRPYSRAKAAFPLSGDGSNKYWPACGRIDAAYGDRNLFCTCSVD